MHRFIYKNLLLIVCICLLAVSSQAARLNVACVGGDDTWGTKVAARENNSYPAILERLLNATGQESKVENLGVAGKDLLRTGSYWATEQWKNFSEGRADVVVALLSKQEMDDKSWADKKALDKNIKLLFEKLVEVPGGPQVIVAAPHDFSRKGRVSSSDVFARLRSEAAKHGVRIVCVNRLSRMDPFDMGRIAKQLHGQLASEWLKDFDVGKELRDRDIKYVAADFSGYQTFEFKYEGLSCRILQPSQTREVKPWILRKGFRTSFGQFDQSMLNEGYHVFIVNVAGLLGGPEAVKRWDAIYDLACDMGFNSKVFLEGTSRSGLLLYNWAYENPKKVAGIYADNPVCDFRSWPFKTGAKRQCQEVLRAYNISEDQVESYEAQPNKIDRLKPLADADVPLLHVQALKDAVVPAKDNGNVLETNYKKLGGHIEVIRKPGSGHHPHSLTDPEPITRFALKAYGLDMGYTTIPQAGLEYRGSVGNWVKRLNEINSQLEKNADKVQLLMLGDSITWTLTRESRMSRTDGNRDFDKRLAKYAAFGAGICGDRTEHILYRLENGHLDHIDPKVILLMIGVNNLGPQGRFNGYETHEGVKAIVKLLRKRKPKTKILLFGMFPTGRDNNDPKREQYEIAQGLNKTLGDLPNVEFVDLKSQLMKPDGKLDHTKMKGDNIHMMGAGYTVWFDAIESTMDILINE